jgi:hypothetical protein
LSIKDCVDRIYRVLNREQKGDKDWRNVEIGEVCYKVQRCHEKDKHIYSDPKRIEVAELFSKAFFPEQQSMLAKSSREPQKDAKLPNSTALRGEPAIRTSEWRYTGPIGKNAPASNAIKEVLLTSGNRSSLCCRRIQSPGMG